MTRIRSSHRSLLIFNLVTDEDDPILGFSVEWLRTIASRVGHVDVITMRAGSHSLPDNVVVHSVGKELGYSEIRRAFQFYRILWNLLRARCYDACFAHMMPLFAAMAAPLLRSHSIPITLWYAHGSSSWLLRIAASISHHVVSPNEASYPLPGNKVHFVGHGIDTTTFAPPDTSETRQTDDFVFVSVGRIDPVKNIETIVRAVRWLDRGTRPVPFRVRFIGPSSDPQYRDSLRAFAQAQGVDHRIELLEARPFSQVPDAYRGAHAALNVSRTRSLDKAGLEAMSCALPLVSTNPAYASILNEVAPFLYCREGRLEDFIGSLRRLMTEDVATRSDIGHQLRAIVVSEHSLERLVDLLIEDVLFAPRASTPSVLRGPS